MVNQDLGRVCVVLRGEYDPTASYERLDCVSYQGSSYLVRKHCIGVPPAEGEYYQIAAKAGADGAPGADGSDASVTAGNIKTALGYTPGKMVYNLLDNSDFQNPVNQKGVSSGDLNWEYFIDRWMLASSDGTRVHYGINPSSGSINVSTSTGKDIYMVQRLPIGVIDTTKSYTYAYDSSDKNIFISAAVLEKLEGSVQFVAVIPSGTSVRWIALYEGEYTAETLPEYQPKGYGAELLECRRYHRNNEFFNCVKTYGNHFSISTCINMRVIPTVEFVSFSPYGINNIEDFSGCSIAITQNVDGVCNFLYATLPTCAAHSAGGLSVNLSADL